MTRIPFARASRACFLVAALLLIASHVFADARPPKVLFLYNKQSKERIAKPSGIPERVVFLTSVLGHFRCEIAQVPLSNYYSGLMKAYDIVVYLGEREDKQLPPYFLTDCIKYKNITILWIITVIQMRIFRKVRIK